MQGSTENERLRAVIADDDPFARRVIKDVLQQAVVVVVIAEARDGRQAVELALFSAERESLQDLLHSLRHHLDRTTGRFTPGVSS